VVTPGLPATGLVFIHTSFILCFLKGSLYPSSAHTELGHDPELRPSVRRKSPHLVSLDSRPGRSTSHERSRGRFPDDR
jgi:hypothetical protein